MIARRTFGFDAEMPTFLSLPKQGVARRHLARLHDRPNADP